MAIVTRKATKKQAKLRMVIHGPSGSGKTYTALNLAKEFGDNVVLIDTENHSASKYCKTPKAPEGFDFSEVLEEKGGREAPPFNGNYDPRRLMSVLKEIEADVVIVDSLSHFWNAPGGFLEMVDTAAKRMNKPDSFAAWKEIDPHYRAFINTIQNLPYHFIGTLRAKTEYEKSNEGGKSKITKLGMAPEIRAQFEYEFDVELAMNMQNEAIVGKTRCTPLRERGVFPHPGKDLANVLKEWLDDGAPVVAAPVAEGGGTFVDTMATMALIHTRAGLDTFAKTAKDAFEAGEMTAPEFEQVKTEYRRRREGMQ